MTARGRRVSILGVPTSAGSHNPGQEKAPAAWRAAGLISELRAAGVDVEDRGDLPETRYRPVEPVDGLRDVDRVVEVARRVADEVAAIRVDGRLPLVLGGDCTITLGVLAGFGAGGLVYFDGDADLDTPERSDSAVADTMGMTHMLGGGTPRSGPSWPAGISSRPRPPRCGPTRAGRLVRPAPTSRAAPVPTWCTSTWTCWTPACSRWRTSRISPGSPWTRSAYA